MPKIISDLREQLETTVIGSELEILRVCNQRIWDQGMSLGGSGELLSELDAREVFQRCMDTHEVPDEQRPKYDAALAHIAEVYEQALSRAETGLEKERTTFDKSLGAYTPEAA